MLDDILKGIAGLSPFLAAYPPWVRALFVLWGAATAALLLSLILTQRKETPPPTAVSSPATLAIDTEISESRARLRAARNLRTLRDVENDLPLSKLPAGIYGFTTPWSIRHEDMTLSQRSGGTLTLEVHKLMSGEVHLIGYVSQEGALSLEGTGSSNAINLYTRAWEEASTLASVPISRIASADDRGFRDGYVIDIRLLSR